MNGYKKRHINMTFPATGLRINFLYPVLTLSLCVLFLTFSCLVGMAKSAESLVSSLTNSLETAVGQKQNLLFLPLKINSPSDTVQLADQADTSYMEVLHFRGLTMVSREETNKKLGSQASRPPSFNDLISFAPAGKADYIATGSLTRYGSRISVD
ncbi:MAG: hypothetical protein KAR13_13555, partial [Desulfobulbaceae bacterium]|nr:hypothetical protein [Desulfobulbaceae bacterium]